MNYYNVYWKNVSLEDIAIQSYSFL